MPLQIKRVKIDAISEDPANARHHSDRNIEAIKGSLRKFGQQKPIVVSKNGIVIAGNGTFRAAKQIGWSEIDVVESELESVDLAAFAIADNRSSELASWDTEALTQTIKGLSGVEYEMPALGFSSDELSGLLAQTWEPPALYGDESESSGENPDVKDDEMDVPQAQPNAISVRGDMWLLGEHRLLCGDSTSKEDIELLLDGEKADLLSTDPPYCVDYTGTDRPKNKHGKNAGKDWTLVYREIDIKDIEAFIDAVFAAVLPHTKDHAGIYMWHATMKYPHIAACFERNGLLLHQVVIWVKPVATFGNSFYRWRHEPCAFGWKKGFRPESGFGQLDTIWELDWEGKSRVSGNEHPMQKPTRLFEIPMEMHTKPGDVVLEPFSGSGSQLIAAEKLGRRCRAMEIEPTFVDVAIRRWEKATGKEAVLKSTGETFKVTSEKRKQ